MAYATEAQAIARRGSDYVTVAFDRDNDGVLDSVALGHALDAATDIMDGYLLGRYGLPLDNPPAIFQSLCTDIAIYEGSTTPDVLTEIMIKRRDDAIDYMEKIATGRIKLKLDTDTTGVNASLESSIETRTELSVRSDARRFRRDLLKGLL